MINHGKLTTKLDSIKARIARALMCATGHHEAWEQYVTYTYKRLEPVHMSIESDGHDEVHCAVCKHCRTVYVRRLEE